MKKKRVVITGFGIICGIGYNHRQVFENIVRMESGIKEVRVIDTSKYNVHIASEVRDLYHHTVIPKRFHRKMSRNDILGVSACNEALMLSGLQGSDKLKKACIVLGAGASGMLSAETYRRAYFNNERASLHLLAQTPASITTDMIGEHFGIFGSRTTIATACSSSNSAIGIAADHIRYEGYDICITGGAEALCELTFAGFHNLKNMDKDPCRPFDRNRKGLSLGECGAILVMEDLDHARKRKATIFAEFLDYGCSSDAYHMTTPHPEGSGSKQSMLKAIKSSGLKIADIDYINAHGTGTKLNDSSESSAIFEVFSEKNGDVPISSNKSYIGHCLGAAGAIEAIFSIFALQNNIIPPTLRLEERDDTIRGNIIGNRITEKRINFILSNSFGFGGNNTSIILKKWEG